MPQEITICIAIELSHSSWIVAVRLPDVEKSRLHRLEGGDTGGAPGASPLWRWQESCLIALWRYVETGVVPEGVKIKAEGSGPLPFDPECRFSKVLPSILLISGALENMKDEVNSEMTTHLVHILWRSTV